MEPPKNTIRTRADHNGKIFVTKQMMRAKVYRFLPVPSDEQFVSVEWWPTIKKALLLGVDLDTPIKAGKSSIAFTVRFVDGQQTICVHQYPYQHLIACVFTWAPKETPTPRDAEFVMNLQRAKAMFRDPPDAPHLKKEFPRFHTLPRQYLWYEVFWQVALMPLCDDLKRILVYCLIDV